MRLGPTPRFYPLPRCLGKAILLRSNLADETNLAIFTTTHLPPWHLESNRHSLPEHLSCAKEKARSPRQPFHPDTLIRSDAHERFDFMSHIPLASIR
ncbi:hypothetical protein M419DRAFT_120997 [Trichoderma reesei RUT C-30]|uniref:Uncharacterized protein n=1 Tax=Hypocrea jecorina (strain ATCC 56765 / BCRC 32924 / NRRL 11460 / Rut C-30) TaxID=1344414 RepID=A0A024RWW3_HYPJR|nr:hypothetical protein M419DRAFT_120997 [Trichoderma reesei RUT C-30]